MTTTTKNMKLAPMWYGLLLEKHRLRWLASKRPVDERWLALYRFVLPTPAVDSTCDPLSHCGNEPGITGWIHDALVSEGLLRGLEDEKLDYEFVNYGRGKVFYKHFEDHPRRLLLHEMIHKWWWNPDVDPPKDAPNWAARIHRHAGRGLRRFSARMRHLSTRHPSFLSLYRSLEAVDIEHLDDILDDPEMESRYHPTAPEASPHILEKELGDREWFQDIRNDVHLGRLWEFVIVHREDPGDSTFLKKLVGLFQRGMMNDGDEKKNFQK